MNDVSMLPRRKIMPHRQIMQTITQLKLHHKTSITPNSSTSGSFLTQLLATVVHPIQRHREGKFTAIKSR